MSKKQVLAFRIKSDGSRMDLDVYEAIGESYWSGEGVRSKDVLAKLRDSKPSEVYMRVNSGGGDLFEALAIANLLAASRAKVTVAIDGVSASAATHLWPVGASVTMARNAMMMIHNAWTIQLGNADEMRKSADLLDKADALQSSHYAQYSQSRGVMKSDADFSALMSEETWLTADEALAVGLIDYIGEDVAIAASVDVSAFRRPPLELLGRLAAAHQLTVPEAAPAERTEAMDIKAMQAAIEAKDLELATLRSERDAASAELGKLQVEAAALKTQNATIVAERDGLLTERETLQAKAIESEVDALVPGILDPAERDNFVALAKTSRPLFDSMIAQRKPRQLTTQVVDEDLPPAVTNSAVGADAKFDDLVSKDLT